MKPLFIILISSFILLSTGCVSGNKAEATLVKIEKPSPAEEANRWADFGGKVLSVFKQK